MPPIPRVKTFLVADQVFRQEGTKKWCIVGVFDRIMSPHFPAVHPCLGVYLKLCDAEGEYRVGVEFQDSSGRCLARLDGHLRMTNRLDEAELGFQTNNLTIPNPGTYFLKLFFNGEPSEGPDVRIEAVKLDAKAV